MQHVQQSDIDSGAAFMGKAGIATAGTTYSFFGLPYSELAAILTCVYVALQIADFIHRRWLKK